MPVINGTDPDRCHNATVHPAAPAATTAVPAPAPAAGGTQVNRRMVAAEIARGQQIYGTGAVPAGDWGTEVITQCGHRMALGGTARAHPKASARPNCSCVWYCARCVEVTTPALVYGSVEPQQV